MDTRQPKPTATILIVDDDHDIRDALKTGLEESTAEWLVLTAPDAQSGLELAGKHRPDVVILDLNMPVINGFGFVERLRSDLALRTVKVLMLTANASPHNEWQSIDRDIDDFMAKPFELEELEIRVKSLLDKRHGTSRRI